MDRQTARMASIKPTPFQPPFGAWDVGQMGLLVWNANLMTLEAMRPNAQAVILDSRRLGWLDSENQVAVHARQDIQIAKPTAKSRAAGFGIRYPTRPTRERKWHVRRFLSTMERSDRILRRNGETVDMTITS